jgi:PAS domain S-box-containing protein
MPYCDEPEEAEAVRTAGPAAGNAHARADIAERARIESRLGLLIDGVVDFAIFLLDPNGIITNWNAGAERIKGYSAEEIVGQHLNRFYTEEDRAADLPRRVLEAAARDGRYEAEGWRVRKDGSRFWANVVIDPIRDKETGELLGFAKITRDITERREAAIALRRAQEQLAQAQKMEGIGQLTSGVAHDFNNLLTIIQGNLETLQRTLQSAAPNPARMRRAINNAMHGVERAAALTQRLLAFSRRQPLDPKVVDANDLVRGMTDLLRRTLGERIATHSVLAEDLWLTQVDPNQLETALLNLAVNARDAMPDGGRLTIETINAVVDDDGTAVPHAQAASGEHVVISVSDTGCGMTREVLQRAFEPFFTTKESGHGTGLGLAQVYGFVKQSGGHIRIRSEPGQGTTVKFYLPRIQAEAAADSADTAAAAAESGAVQTILVVEDDAD